jgi:hypothetical protein
VIAVKEIEHGRLPPLRLPALAIGALACGALAIGAVAIARLAVGQLAVKRARFRSVEIDDLTVRRLRVIEEAGEERADAPAQDAIAAPR